jgi:hypothetical protein
MANSHDPDIVRGRRAAAAAKAAGAPALDQALAFIETAFDETAAARREHLRRLAVALVRAGVDSRAVAAAVADKLDEIERTR